MSLITRCPACTTIFKVVPDQLRVSDGWVRCGQCDEVFDANAYLQTAVPLHTVEQVAIEPAPVKDTHVSQCLDDLSQGAKGGSTVYTTAAEPGACVDGQTIDAVLGISPGLDERAPSFSSLAGVYPAGAHSAGADTPPAFVADAVTPQFLALVPQRFRGLWILSACLLTALLGFQWVLQDRDRIAATVPALSPVLTSMCLLTGCKISPVKNIDTVVINSSAFSKLHSDIYQLSFSIQSTSLIDIALPSLELTLTDIQDQPLVRRVFSPDELGRVNQNLRVGSDWEEVKTLILSPSSDLAQIAGYRLLAFYP